ncbi:MAG TPA: MarR family transcriptional regulator [Longimicrobiales bacterium]
MRASDLQGNRHTVCSVLTEQTKSDTFPRMANDFIDKFCVVAEQDGFPRIAGRIMGFLLLHEGPFTLDELAEELQISKTSASTNARLLEQHEIIERVVKAGDRRDFYRLAENHWERMFDVVRKKMHRFQTVLDETMNALPANETYGRERLREAQRFHAFMLEHIDTRIEEWRHTRVATEE